MLKKTYYISIFKMFRTNSVIGRTDRRTYTRKWPSFIPLTRCKQGFKQRREFKCTLATQVNYCHWSSFGVRCVSLSSHLTTFNFFSTQVLWRQSSRQHDHESLMTHQLFRGLKCLFQNFYAKFVNYLTPVISVVNRMSRKKKCSMHFPTKRKHYPETLGYVYDDEICIHRQFLQIKVNIKMKILFLPLIR